MAAANSCNPDVKKDFIIFGKYIFQNIDQLFASSRAMVNQEVSSTGCKVLKVLGELVTVVEAPMETAKTVGTHAVGAVKEASDRRKAEKMENLAYKWIDEEEGVQMRETVCRAALALFVSLYPNISRVTTFESTDRRALEILAKVAVSNFKNWYIKQRDKKPFSVELITEGVTTDLNKSSDEQTELYDKVTNTKYDDASLLLSKPALVMDDGINKQRYYVNQSRRHPLKYGYRFLFDHELKNKAAVLKGYKQIENPNINLVKPKLEKEIWRELMESRLKEHIDYCPAPVDTFVGRDDQLKILKTMFNQHQMIALVGTGGLGKTQLSRKYVQVNKAQYQYRYWLESETPEKLKNSFKKLAKKLHIKSDNIDNEVINDVYQKLGAIPTILLFDNVEKPADVYAYLPTRIDLPPDVTIHVLVTSRSTDWTCDEQIECYKLQPFNILESLKIFKKYFDKSWDEPMENKWKELAKMLGYLPLALKITASAIHKLYKHNSELDTVLADYMKQITKGTGRLLKYPLTEYENRTIYESMLQPLKQFENKTDDEWKLAATLINAAAYMYPDGIRKERLLKLIDNDENAWILDEALVLLTEYSLLDQVVYSDKNYYTVHRMLQASLRHNHIENGTADMYYTVALKCALDNDYRVRHPNTVPDVYSEAVLRYANERASAVVAHYKENLSSSIFTYLVQCKAITAVQAVFEQMTTNEIQSVIRQEDLLYHAVWSKNFSMIQLLCNNGADINQVTNQIGMPPLHLALYLENMEISKYLLENGAKSTLRASSGRTAIDLAFQCGNLTMVSDIFKTDKALILLDIGYSFNTKDFLSTFLLLLGKGADIAAVNDNGDTVLYLAAGNACAPAITIILERKKDLINVVNNDGRTAFHNVGHNHDGSLDKNQEICSTMRVLVANCADLAKVDNEGNTVLHAAAKYTCAAAVSFILEQKEDLINIVNNNGRTALQEVCDCEYKNDEFIASTVRVLVDKGSDITQVDSQGNTVLHLAARRLHAATVSLILERKKELINIVNASGQTALQVVIQCYSSFIKVELVASTVRVLVDNGADFTKVDSEGNTVLHAAARLGDVATVSLMLELKKDLMHIVNASGQTALYVILYDITILSIKDESTIQTIRAFYDSGVDLLKCDSQGNTVLHFAARAARPAVITFILELKKDLINIVNADGQTALHVLGNRIRNPFRYNSEAKQKEILETGKNIIQILIANGLSLDTRDKMGRTPHETIAIEYKDLLLQVAGECNK